MKVSFKFSIFTLALFVLFFFARTPAWGAQQVLFTIGQNTYLSDGRKVTMDARPFLAGDRVFLPVRYLALSLGVDANGIAWDDTAQSVTLVKEGVTVKLAVGSRSMQVNGADKLLDEAPLLKDGRVYLPARFVAEAFGYRVGWSNDTQTVALLAPTLRVEVTADAVNIRTGPGTGFPVLETANHGDRFPVLNETKDWFEVEASGGKDGWVASWLVRVLPPEPKTSRGEQNGRPESENSQSAAEGQNVLTSLQVSQQGEATKITVTASTAIDSNIFCLPGRLVIDFAGVRPGALPASLLVNATVVQDIRTGYFRKDPDATRLVCDLNQYPPVYQAQLSADRKTLSILISAGQGRARGATVALDPGHGGDDPGAIGPSGTQEKAVTLKVAAKVAEVLSKQGFRVILTRRDDTDPSLDDRTAAANQAKADLFISIHMNSFPDPGVGGTTTYFLSAQGLEEAVSAKDTTPQAEEIRRQKSSRLANCLQAALVKNLGLTDRGVRGANFAVLRTTQMPAVLIEAAFISNPQEESLMATDAFAENIAQGIAQGIADYLASA